MKHIVCYSGGHSSALVAIEVVRRYGIQDVILLNHDIIETKTGVGGEDSDIKRFKEAIASYLGLPITYANMPDWDKKDQFDTVVEVGAFKVGNGTALCTHRMKTEPFSIWLYKNVPDKDCIIYYGFDKDEGIRIQRRSSILAEQGYKTDFPLALWTRSIQSTKEIGIEPPLTYGVFKHANCIGCLKAGMQHWYAVYCLRPDVWAKAKLTEDTIGYSIIKGRYLDELEERFELMRKHNVEPTEHVDGRTFWADVRKLLKEIEEAPDEKPCECLV